MDEQSSPRTILTADIGTAWTNLALIERVGGVYRLAARVDTPTQSTDRIDLRASLVRALLRMQDIAQRPLLDPEEAPIQPRQGDRGSDLLVVTTSAGGALRCALIGLTDDLSLEPGRMACALTGTEITDEIGLTLDRPVRHRALAGLRTSPPDVIVILGGVDAGPTRPFTSAAAVLSTLYAGTPETERPVIVFAGNLEARRPVADALGASFDYRVVDNIHPRLGESSPQELQRELARVHAERRLPQLGGFEAVSGWACVPIMSSGTGIGVVLQFLSRQGRYGQRVLGLDVGGAGTHLALTGDYPATVQASGPGTAQGLDRLLDGDGMKHIARWLSTPALEAAAPAMLRNRALRPQTLPDGPAEGAVLLAATREALRVPLEALDSLTDGATASIDLIVARGGVINHAETDGLTLLALLDAVQPRGFTRVVMDWASVCPGLGALAQHAPLAALQVLEHDALRELGTVLSLGGRGIAGQPALRFRLEQGTDTAEAEVPWGSLARIALAPGGAVCKVWPLQGAELGDGLPVGPDQFHEYVLPEATLNLIIDARGRPLTLPADDTARYQELQTWQSTLS
ncbi:MAG: glutamate mutase L [Anaerolineae bacterium]